MAHKCRLNDINMSTMDAIMLLSEGYPGALYVVSEIIDRGSQIDPKDILGGFGALLNLDMFGIYGSRIWILYKDVCNENLSKTIGLLRAKQLGFVSISDLNQAIDSHGHGIDLPDLLAKVKERLPDFVLEENDNIEIIPNFVLKWQKMF